jgi:peptidase E
MHKSSDEGMTNETMADRPTDTPSLEELKKLELKPLLVNLRYEFFDLEEITSVIMNAYLDGEQTSKLLKALRNHKRAIIYSINNLKGLNSELRSMQASNPTGRKPQAHDRTSKKA